MLLRSQAEVLLACDFFEAVTPSGNDCRARFLIRDRDGKFPALFDAILADAASRLS